MPYYVNVDQRTLAEPGEIKPSARLSFAGAVGSAITGNVSSVIADYAELQQANMGAKLSRAQAEEAFRAAGIKRTAPDDGYTRSAVDILIKRSLNEELRRRVDEATPWSWIGSPIRGAGMLLAGVADPLNVASAFIPVVRETRAASMIARAGESALSRAGTRAAIGTAEGFAGAAVLEAPTYALRTAMQDDYGLTDSLLNMAFGTVAGGGLHAVGGAFGDALSGGGNPYARFAGLTVPEVRGVLRFEVGKGGIEKFTPAMRRAAGYDMAHIEATAVEAPSIAPRVQSGDLAAVSDAPFARLYETSRESANARALAAMRDDLRAELLADTSGRAEPRVIAELKPQSTSLAERRRFLESEAEFKRRAKVEQGKGLSRKQAEAAARKQLSDELADVKAGEQRIEQITQSNAKAAQAEQDLASLDKGEVPARFAKRVADDAEQILGAAEIARTITGTGEPPAAFVLGMVAPQTRETVMRAALAHMAAGRLPDVDAVLRTDTASIGARSTPQDVAAVAQRQQAPESAYLSDVGASEAGAKTVKDAPKAEGEKMAADELAEATRHLDALRKNLEAAGADKETIAKMTDLKPFDEDIKRAEAIGRAIEAGAMCGLRH